MEPSLSVSNPSFRRPPLDEVVFGVRFEPLGNFKVPFFGLLWQKFRSEYPTVEHATPLTAGTTLAIDTASGAPLPRVWFVNETDDELVQFQVDLLYYNWRHREKEYPRYATNFPKFEAAKNSLESLLAELALDPIIIVEHELTYINQIPQGQGWDTLADLPKVLPIFCVTSENFSFLPHPKNLIWSMRFDLPDSMGNLDVRLNQATRRTDKHPVLLLQLSAKGKAMSATWDSSRAWFNTAHDWIVKGFADLTAPEIQEQFWERER